MLFAVEKNFIFRQFNKNYSKGTQNFIDLLMLDVWGLNSRRTPNVQEKKCVRKTIIIKPCIWYCNATSRHGKETVQGVY